MTTPQGKSRRDDLSPVTGDYARETAQGAFVRDRVEQLLPANPTPPPGW